MAPTFRVLILYALLSALAYAPCLKAPFLNWDDDKYITHNAWVQELSLDHLKLMATKPMFLDYAPVHLLSYALDRAVWGLRAPGFRLTNITLHVANAYLLFLLLIALRLPFHLAWVTGALWLVHPVQVENVAWISQRKMLLAQFFSLLALLLARRMEADGRKGLLYAGSLGAFALALLSKATAVYVVPLLVLIRWREGKPFTRAWLLGWAGFLLPALLIGWITLRTHETPQYVPTSRVLGGVVPTASTMLPVLALDYPSAVLWPTNLSLLHAPPVHENPWNRRTQGALLVIVLAGGLTLFAKERKRDAILWLGWYALALAPVLNILPNSVIMQDRYLYAACGPLIVWFLTLFGPGEPVSARQKAAFVALGGAVLICLLGLTLQRTRVWASPERLWRDTISHAPELQTPHTKLADILVEEGRLEEAELVYQRAISITPNPAWELYGSGGEVFARLGLAKIYERQGRLSEAAPLLEDALGYRASPELMAVVCVHGGYVAMRQRNPARALRYYRRAAELDPRNRDAQRALARLSRGEATLWLRPPDASSPDPHATATAR